MKKNKKIGLSLNKKVVSKFKAAKITGGANTEWRYAGTFYCCENHL
ncbi:MAG: hypothetical protein AAGB24_16470 [Bacteroidota bacterium]